MIKKSTNIFDQKEEKTIMAFNYEAKFVGDSAARTAMISQPMAGRSEEEIRYTRKTAAHELGKQGYVIKDTYFCDEFKSDIAVHNKPVYFLAKAIRAMADCDAVYFCKGWRDARGCRIEHDIAKNYGLIIFYENDEDPDKDKEAEQPDQQPKDCVHLSKDDYGRFAAQVLKELTDDLDETDNIFKNQTKEGCSHNHLLRMAYEINYVCALKTMEDIIFKEI